MKAIKAKDLAKELMKNPELPVIVGKYDRIDDYDYFADVKSVMPM